MESTGRPQLKHFEASMSCDERIIGADPTFIAPWARRKALELSPAICKLSILHGSKTYCGTGFLISHRLFMTSYHVLYNDLDVLGTEVTALFNYETTFDGKELEPVSIACDPASTVGNRHQDWAVITTRTAIPGAPSPLKFVVSSLPEPRVGDSVSIIQHPGGRPKVVSMIHNKIIFTDGQVVRYVTDTVTDTDHGSSGAPVFNDRWELCAIHCRWTTVEGRYCNEGILIRQVMAGLQASGMFHILRSGRRGSKSDAHSWDIIPGKLLSLSRGIISNISSTGSGNPVNHTISEAVGQSNSGNQANHIIPETVRQNNSGNHADHIIPEAVGPWGRGEPISENIPVVQSEPNWDGIPILDALEYKCKWFEDIEEMLQRIEIGSIQAFHVGFLRIQISPYPFTAEGFRRLYYHAKVLQPPHPSRAMVVKKFKLAGGSQSRCERQMEAQTVAAHMAFHFNMSTKAAGLRPGGVMKVKFTLVTMLAVDSKFFNMEEYLNGKWIFCNSGSPIRGEHTATLQTFIHWTYERSHGYFMITDLGGVVQPRPKDSTYTVRLQNPTIYYSSHSKRLSNVGDLGFQHFFKSQVQRVLPPLGPQGA